MSWAISSVVRFRLWERRQEVKGAFVCDTEGGGLGDVSMSELSASMETSNEIYQWYYCSAKYELISRSSRIGKKLFGGAEW
jgi:hypothetical protein